ncbi:MULTISPECIES: hypothetical protein [unclassified Nitratiruptor]|uniref:hypothetical protein n=1 Tax=unclassified Nitratiruptor TaxID=2624044 RepID=UPI0019165F6F|nr:MULTISPECIES: hypothetical protein [unclassified Nitratiruptor]
MPKASQANVQSSVQTADGKSIKDNFFQKDSVRYKQKTHIPHKLLQISAKKNSLKKVIFQYDKDTRAFGKKPLQSFTIVSAKSVEKRQYLHKAVQISKKSVQTPSVIQKEEVKIGENKKNDVRNQKIHKNIFAANTVPTKDINENQELEKKSKKQKEHCTEYKTEQTIYAWAHSYGSQKTKNRLKAEDFINEMRRNPIPPKSLKDFSKQNEIQLNKKQNQIISRTVSNIHAPFQHTTLPKKENLQNNRTPFYASKNFESKTPFFTKPFIKEESQKSAQKIKHIADQSNDLEIGHMPLNKKRVHQPDIKQMYMMKTFDGSTQYVDEDKSQSKHRKSTLNKSVQEAFFETERQNKPKQIVGERNHLDVSQIHSQLKQKQIFEKNSATKEKALKHSEEITQNQEISTSQNIIIGSERKESPKRIALSKQIDSIEKTIEQHILNTHNDPSQQNGDHNANSDSSTKSFVSRSDDQTTLFKESHKQQQFIITLDQTRIRISLHHQSVQMQFVSMTPLMMEDGLQHYIDKVMQQTGFDKYRITLKDKEKRRDFSNTTVLPSTRSESSLVNVKI